MKNTLSTTVIALVILAVTFFGTPVLNAQDTSMSSWQNISTATSFTVSSISQLMSTIGISGYFQENGLTSGPFPDNAIFEVYGLDPGDCKTKLVRGTPVCTNYRFQAEAIVPASLSNGGSMFYLTDLNAQTLNWKDDPKGTAYAMPYTLADGTHVLGLVAIVTAEPQRGMSDAIGTPGWFSVLSGGGAAIQPGGSTMKFIVQYNPRPGDPLTFTFGGDGTPLTSVFTLIAVGNQFEPVQVTGVDTGVYDRLQ